MRFSKAAHKKDKDEKAGSTSKSSSGKDVIKKRSAFSIAKLYSAKKNSKKFHKGATFSLFIGDEGAILIYMRNNVVLSRQFVSDNSEQNLEEIRHSLEVDSQAPICLIIDSLDQTYVQQSLPPVSQMSVKKLMKRRLERDFGVDDIKGAVLLGREDTGRKDWNFLMVSIEKSPQIKLWLNFIYELPNRFIGIYLASMETEVILKKIEQAMPVPENKTPAKWKFFVSHNKVGGFRQVILKDDRIVFTRMAQPIGESTPEVIAGNIEQEMQSTIEYMKRLSFDPKTGLDIYIIAGSHIKSLIDKSKFGSSNLIISSPFETAQYLGIDGATQPTDQFGDVILAASISSSTKHILKFTTPESIKFDKLNTIFYAQRLAGVLVLLCMLGYLASDVSDLYGYYKESEEIAENHDSYQTKLNNIYAEIKKDNLNVDKTADTIELYQLLQQQKTLPVAFISKIESIIKPPVVIKSVEWSADDKVNTAASKLKTSVVFVLGFPDVKNVETWKTVSKQLLAAFQANFKGYSASFTHVPNQFTETEKLDINFNAPLEKAPAIDSNQEVQLTIKEQ